MGSPYSRSVKNVLGICVRFCSRGVSMILLCCPLLSLVGCVTEAEHIRPTTLTTGKPGFVITCNSNRYDRCLSRAARACGDGAYTIIPQLRSSTFRPGDMMPGMGNSDSILVSCGNPSE